MRVDYEGDELDAALHAMGDYLVPYTNPMITGAPPGEEKKELLRAMGRAWLKTRAAAGDGEEPGALTLSMGNWTEEVEA